MRGGRVVLFGLGGVALAGGLAGLTAVVFAQWEKVMDARAQRIFGLLAARLPARLLKWAGPIAYGASRTTPADFPTTDGDAQLAWALNGAAVMDRESEGGDGAGYAPRGEWNGEGDNGHAVTPWQLDKRYHAKYLGRSDRTPETDSAYAMALLSSRWKEARSRTDNDELAIAATDAAYNADQHKVFAALDAGGGFDQIDALTTGRNYGSDVLRRFRGLYS